MSDATPTTTAELLSRVDQAWSALEGTIGRLTSAQLGDVRDPAGWAVKDHLMHVAAWEDAFVARLAGRPAHEALGIDESALSGDGDAVNAVIFGLHRHRPIPEVLDALRASHRAARARLAALGDRAVSGQVAGVLPPGGESDGSPAAAWIGGNTWEHYEAHRGWIRALVGER